MYAIRGKICPYELDDRLRFWPPSRVTEGHEILDNFDRELARAWPQLFE